MEFMKDRHKWSLILAGFFFLGVCFCIGYVYRISGQVLLHDNTSHIATVMYGGITVVLVSGSLAIWLAVYKWKEAAISDHDSILLGKPGWKTDENIHGPAGIPQTPAGGNEQTGEAGEGLSLESGIALFNDALERKRIELEIQHQNKKITESINYAKRIQSAILPNMRLIHRVLPQAFILYKPRDVVSGDFPWFAQVKNEIFMAAVDCTGHGVPGALLSLVGYFLLNDIVRSRGATDPGKILDLLDEGVSTTLRPSEDAGTKDGMDISLCKINLERREVEYAGAHRPLYVMREGVLEEIKGNRFPIGGGIFKNQTNFTTYRIRLNSGDSIYFCTDGYCDQFGGPEGKKFGVRQLRHIIAKAHALPMNEAHLVFDEQWETWKGDQKQTDDVLLIGIKF